MPKPQKHRDKKTFRARSGIPVLPELNLPTLMGITVLVLIVFIAYFPSLNGGFIFDDNILLTDNALIKSATGWRQFWGAVEAQVFPISNLTLWIEWRLWGIRPTGYHVTNLILHIIESLLIWIILRKMSIPGAFWAALIFSVHPVNVESAAWIAQRKGMLAMLFFLLSILCYLKYAIPFSCTSHQSSPSSIHCPSSTVHRLLFYGLSLSMFILGMFSKGSIAVLPVLLMGILWWERKLTHREMAWLMPFFLVAVVLSGVNAWFQSYGLDRVARSATFMERLLGAGGVAWFYLYKAFVPLNLVFLYPQWQIEADNPLWWLPLAAAAAITAVLWLYRERGSRSFLFAWGYFCVSLIPVLGFVDIGFMQYTLVCDHYQHTAIIGVIALAAAGWSLWRERLQGPARWAAGAVALAALGVLMLLTWRQNGLYINATKLYQATLQKNPDSWVLHNNLGVELENAGRLAEAIEHYRQSLRIKPNYAQAHNNLGAVLNKTGQYQEAVEHCEQALRIKSKYPKAHYNLADALVKMGRTQEAIDHYEQALQLNFEYPKAHNNLGIVLNRIGRPREAIEHYEYALRFDPNFAEARINLGNALLKAGRLLEAIDHYQQALRIKPELAQGHFNLAAAYAGMGRSSEAVAAALKALELARLNGQTALAKNIEDWLQSYRDSPSSR